MAGFDEELVALLQSQGVGVYNVSLFLSSKAKQPEGDGPFLTIILTGGTTPERTHNSVAVPAYQRPSAQLVAHATNYSAAKTMARAAYNALVGVRNTLVSGGVWYREINPLQEPFDLGLDGNQRQRVAFNVAVIKGPS